MSYKIEISLTEKDVREKLKANGWILIEPGCIISSKDSSTYIPPETCHWFNDNKKIRNVEDLMKKIYVVS